MKKEEFKSRIVGQQYLTETKELKARNSYWEGHARGTREGLGKALELADQLDEPELPVIPQFVADYLDDFKKQNLTLGDALDTHFEDDKQIHTWLYEDGEVRNDEVFARAWLYGYTIEKEPKYLVKVRDQNSWLYLKSMQLYKDVETRTDLNSNFGAWKEKAIKFTNKEQAEGIAKFFNGEVVEEVPNV